MLGIVQPEDVAGHLLHGQRGDVAVVAGDRPQVDQLTDGKHPLGFLCLGATCPPLGVDRTSGTFHGDGWVALVVLPQPPLGPRDHGVLVVRWVQEDVRPTVVAVPLPVGGHARVLFARIAPRVEGGPEHDVGGDVVHRLGDHLGHVLLQERCQLVVALDGFSVLDYLLGQSHVLVAHLVVVGHVPYRSGCPRQRQGCTYGRSPECGVPHMAGLHREEPVEQRLQLVGVREHCRAGVLARVLVAPVDQPPCGVDLGGDPLPQCLGVVVVRVGEIPTRGVVGDVGERPRGPHDTRGLLLALGLRVHRLVGPAAYGDPVDGLHLTGQQIPLLGDLADCLGDDHVPTRTGLLLLANRLRVPQPGVTLGGGEPGIRVHPVDHRGHPAVVADVVPGGGVVQVVGERAALRPGHRPIDVPGPKTADGLHHVVGQTEHLHLAVLVGATDLGRVHVGQSAEVILLAPQPDQLMGNLDVLVPRHPGTDRRDDTRDHLLGNVELLGPRDDALIVGLLVPLLALLPYLLVQPIEGLVDVGGDVVDGYVDGLARLLELPAVGGVIRRP